MAEFRFQGDGGGSRYEFEGGPIHSRIAQGLMLREVLEWCQDGERPGFYTCRPTGLMGCIFFFSDKNVAFEFKMVWG